MKNLLKQKKNATYTKGKLHEKIHNHQLHITHLLQMKLHVIMKKFTTVNCTKLTYCK